MSDVENIKNAIALLMGSDEPLTGDLAIIMTLCLQQGSLDFQTVVAQSGDNVSEVLLLAWDWKRRLYASMGEPAFEQIPPLVKEIVRLARYQRITGAGIHTACAHTGLQDRTGAMIAILKGDGVISPNLRTGNPMEKTKSPLYDIHPVLVHLYSMADHAP